MASPRLLLIGWDSADWRLLRPLLDAGKMPHLAKLIASGISGNIATLRPILSPMLWTSIATGKRADKHGILGFSEPDPVGGGVRPITNLSRKTKAVWNILSQNGKRCNVVGWWPSHPAEPISGVMVSNHFQAAASEWGKPWPVLPGTVHPPRLARHLAPLRLHPGQVDGDTLLPFVPRAAEIDQSKDKRLFSLAKVIAETATVHAAATGILQLEPWDFMAVYYDALDHFGHGFMRYHPPRRPAVREEDFALYSGVMETACRFHDMMLGVLMQLAGTDTRILLMSDHGFHPDHLRPERMPNEPAGPAAEHRAYGVFVLAGPGIRRGETLAGAGLLDMAPTILHSFGLAVGEDMDGKVLLPVFEEPDGIRRIPSWDAVEGEAGLHPPDTRLEAQDTAAALQQLAALGYIEEPNPDKALAVEEAVREQQYHLAQVFMDARRWRKALEILDGLAGRWPEESRFGLKALQCRLALGEAEEARKNFEQLKERRLRAAQGARAELARLTGEKKDLPPESWTEKERRLALKLRGRAVVDPQALAYFEAQVGVLEGKKQEALEMFQNLLAAAAPARKGDLLLRIGSLCQELGRQAEACASFSAALDVDADSPAAHLGLAVSLLFLRRKFEAAAHALRAIELDVQNPRAHFFYGVALIRCGQARWAADSFEEAVRLAPRFRAAHRRLAFLYARHLRQPDKARRHRDLASAQETGKDGSEASAAPEAVVYPGETLALVSLTGRVRVPPEEWITVVTGLPRSGTSLMMQMLAAGGMAVLTDERRGADASNAKGYFEHEAAKRLAENSDWLEEARGKAVKIVVPLLQFLPPRFAYKILFMDRLWEEILASQEAMIRRLGRKAGGAGPGALANLYARQASRCLRHVRQLPSADCLGVGYPEVIETSEETIAKIRAFLGLPGLDAEAMRAVVAPALRHHGPPADQTAAAKARR